MLKLFDPISIRILALTLLFLPLSAYAMCPGDKLDPKQNETIHIEIFKPGAETDLSNLSFAQKVALVRELGMRGATVIIRDHDGQDHPGQIDWSIDHLVYLRLGTHSSSHRLRQIQSITILGFEQPNLVEVQDGIYPLAQMTLFSRARFLSQTLRDQVVGLKLKTGEQISGQIKSVNYDHWTVALETPLNGNVSIPLSQIEAVDPGSSEHAAQTPPSNYFIPGPPLGLSSPQSKRAKPIIPKPDTIFSRDMRINEALNLKVISERNQIIKMMAEKNDIAAAVLLAVDVADHEFYGKSDGKLSPELGRFLSFVDALDSLNIRGLQIEVLFKGPAEESIGTLYEIVTKSPETAIGYLDLILGSHYPHKAHLPGKSPIKSPPVS